MASKQQVLRLYKEMLRNASKFESYNYRKYAERRVKEDFHANKSLAAGSAAQQQALARAQEQAAVIYRQVVISKMYPPEAKSIMESLNLPVDDEARREPDSEWEIRFARSPAWFRSSTRHASSAQNPMLATRDGRTPTNALSYPVAPNQNPSKASQRPHSSFSLLNFLRSFQRFASQQSERSKSIYHLSMLGRVSADAIKQPRTSIFERISLPSSSKFDKPQTPRDTHYAQHSSGEQDPGQEDYNEDGALRAGGAPSLLSRESCGLLAQYAAVGLIMGTLPSTVTPFLSYYLNMEGQATTAARALLGIPWSLKVFVGIISDCFPICGYRRRPYMVLGWSICALCLLAMALTPVGKPYFPEASWRKLKPINYTDAQKLAINHAAPETGGKYIILMMVATMGYLVADVAADGVVVEYAQREPLACRGRTQTAIYTVRNLFTIFASVLVGFGLSSPPYGGDFDFGISFPRCMLVLALFCVPVIPMTWLFVKERKVQAPSARAYLAMLWATIQRRAIYQVIAYSFFSGVFGGLSYVAVDPVTIYWARATSFSISIAQIIGAGITVVTLTLTGKYGLHWNWRTMTAVTTLSVVAIDAICTMLTVWDVVRSQWFWLGLPIVEAVPAGIGFIISTYVVVELADVGNEAAIYGLMTTVGNLSGPFSSALTKSLNAQFSVYNEDILNDTHDVRRDVTITILLSYASKLVSLAFLVWLPRQKEDTQALKRDGGSSKTLGAVTIAYCLLALAWSIMTNLFSIFNSTRCLKITGGCKH